MPRLSDDTLLQRAIGRAILDRESLVDCYGGVGNWADDARELAAKFEALRGKCLASLSADELETARLCFVYSEQWEQSLADANATAGTKWTEAPQRAARLFHEARMRRWGRTVQEQIVADSRPVSVRELNGN